AASGGAEGEAAAGGAGHPVFCGDLGAREGLRPGMRGRGGNRRRRAGGRGGARGGGRRGGGLERRGLVRRRRLVLHGGEGGGERRNEDGYREGDPTHHPTIAARQNDHGAPRATGDRVVEAMSGAARWRGTRRPPTSRGGSA